MGYRVVYLLTFNCYGARLPDDPRGWVERPRGDHRGGHHDPNSGLHKHCCEEMKEQPHLLDLIRAKKVLTAIQEVCRFREWEFVAAHVRTNHVHVIVGGIKDPASAITTFKAYSSRALNHKGTWSRRESARPVVAAGVSAAIDYVLNQQGEVFVSAGPGLVAGL